MYGLGDAVHFLISNPISSTASSYASSAANVVRWYLVPSPKVEPIHLYKLAAASGPYIRLAAISGALAVGLGAYGSHIFPLEHYPEFFKIDRKQVFETASRYHFFHTLALLGLPMCRYPFLAATFFVSGIVMFSGSYYYTAFTGDTSYGSLVPCGGLSFIIGWLAMCI